ncbi:MAG: alpha/beta fold hydrolase [Hyphomonas sp.]|uniref:bifunctional alpha/beta hydrolase/OsmC family protein n=1 Tax=Hyphomonas sp. TaxID=87 RepID=UPI00349FE7FB
MKTETVTFVGGGGQELAGRIERPAGTPRAWAIFAHCFTCSKDSVAAVRVSRALTAQGFGVLRFDFAGIGASGGRFEHTTFSSNVDDVVAAADYVRSACGAPALLIGHSLGGAAVLAAAGRISDVKAVAAIGAPADVAHIEQNFADAVAEIETEGTARVALGGKIFTVRRELLEDIRNQPQMQRISGMRKALLILHAPGDMTVGIENATMIYRAAKHPKSFVSLDGADHFLSKPEDAAYAASVITAWAARYMPMPEAAGHLQGSVVAEEAGQGPYTNLVRSGRHSLMADEPVDVGGADAGPSPYDLLAASLAACKSMTMRMYANRKQWKVDQIAVSVKHDKVHAADCADCETREGKIDVFTVSLTIEGDLDAEQRARLIEISGKCPVHRTLMSEVKIRLAD